jgi:hypothetical protein
MCLTMENVFSPEGNKKAGYNEPALKLKGRILETKVDGNIRLN